VQKVISNLAVKGKNIYFLSNNSSKSKDDYVVRLKRLGFEVDNTQIVLSTDGLLDYLNQEQVEKIHVLGTHVMKETLASNGYDINTDTPEYVVIGYDTELTYQKLVDACNYINKGVDIIATHGDVSCPSEYGPIPDIGSILEMIRLTTGKKPIRIFGKPDPKMLSALFTSKKLVPKKTLVVGDRMHTDIQLSKEVGCYGLLVLSGETTRDQLENSKIQPEFVLNSVADM
jgi:HAD superfamily hydrolase (TIGR01450 family)